MTALLHFPKTSTSDDIIREITSSEGSEGLWEDLH